MNPNCPFCKIEMMEIPMFGTASKYVCFNKDCDSYKNERQETFAIAYYLSEAVKHDQDKLRYDLIPTDALKEVVKVFNYGAKKYTDRNWEKGMDWGRLYGAIQRHLNAFWSGEEINKEDGELSHLAQAAWGCLCLEAYRLRKIGNDTREKIKK